MEEVAVLTTTERMIEIQQTNVGEDNPTVIVISPDQVDVLIMWLREAKQELQPEKEASGLI